MCFTRMKEEMETLQRDLKAVETGYGENVLQLALVRAHIRKRFGNAAVAEFLNTHDSEIAGESNAMAT